jgi:hypothetical protein
LNLLSMSLAKVARFRWFLTFYGCIYFVWLFVSSFSLCHTKVEMYLKWHIFHEDFK